MGVPRRHLQKEIEDYNTASEIFGEGYPRCSQNSLDITDVTRYRTSELFKQNATNGEWMDRIMTRDGEPTIEVVLASDYDQLVSAISHRKDT